MLSNAGEDTEDGSGDSDSTSTDAREAKLHSLGLDVDDRMLKKGHIEDATSSSCMSTPMASPRPFCRAAPRWTSTGLNAQSNNAIVIGSPGLAAEYLRYWKALKADTDAAQRARATSFRRPNSGRTISAQGNCTDLKGEDDHPAGSVQAWFSPSTTQKSVPSKKKGAPPTPVDLAGSIRRD